MVANQSTSTSVSWRLDAVHPKNMHAFCALMCFVVLRYWYILSGHMMSYICIKYINPCNYISCRLTHLAVNLSDSIVFHAHLKPLLWCIGRMWRIIASVTIYLLVPIMVCRLFGTKPLSGPMLAYLWLNPRQQISVKFFWKNPTGDRNAYHTITPVYLLEVETNT